MCRNRRRRCAVMAAAGSLFIGGGLAWADHFSATWTTDGPGNWTNPLRWSTDPNYPNNGADTFDATIALPNAFVTLAATTASINDFTFSAGTLTGGGTLNIAGTALWDGGNLNGSGQININDTLLINGSDREYARYTINVASGATVQWSGATLNSDDDAGGGGIINNAGVIDDSTDNGWYWGNVLSPILNNSGTYIKSAGSTDSLKTVWAAVHNTGLVDVQASDLWLAGGGQNTGSFMVAENARLIISDFNQLFSGAGAPTTTFSSTSTIDSAGTVYFYNSFGNATTEFSGTYDAALTIIDPHDPGQMGNDGRVTFLNGATVNATIKGALDVRSGTVRFETGQGSVSFSDGTLSAGEISTDEDLFFDTIAWSGGTIRGNSPTNVSTGTIQILGTDPKGLVDVNLYNGIGSHATISDGSVTLLRSRIINLSNASFDFQGSALLANDGVNNDATNFTNFAGGLLIKSAGSGAAELKSLVLLNDGTVSVQSGTLRLNGGGTHYGSFTIASAATLDLGGGDFFQPHYLNSGATITGAANSDLVISGEVHLLSGSTTQVDRLTVADSGYAVYEGGAVNTGALTLNSSMVLTSGGDKTLKTKSITVVPFSESQLDLSDNKAIVDYDTETGVADGIRQLIHGGYHGGGWDGEGIVSSMADGTTHALGYGDNSVLGMASFGGYAVDGDSVLIKYTYFGDVNLDGKVNLLDLVMFAPHWHTAGVWTDGDFDYNGFVDANDLGLLAMNWQAGNNAPLGQALADAGLPASSIPEPGAIPCIVISMALLKRRRARL